MVSVLRTFVSPTRAAEKFDRKMEEFAVLQPAQQAGWQLPNSSQQQVVMFPADMVHWDAEQQNLTWAQSHAHGRCSSVSPYHIEQPAPTDGCLSGCCRGGRQVSGTAVREEWVFWNDESSMNLDAQGGMYPRVSRSKLQSSVTTRLYYCYYTPAPRSLGWSLGNAAPGNAATAS